MQFGRVGIALAIAALNPGSETACGRLCHAVPDTARHVRIVTAPAESLHVVLDGQGPPVVLIPGLFGAAFGFRKVVPLLASAGYSTVIVEPLGVGTSGRPARADYSLTAQADRIAAALDSLHTGPAIVVGHSIGGSIAFRLAYRHPAFARGIISIEGGPTERATTPSFGRAMRFAPLIRLFGGIGLVRRKVRSMLFASSGDTTWIVGDVIQGYTAGAAADLGATLRAFRAMADSREPELLRPHLPQIGCPVRLLVGGARHVGGTPGDELELMKRSLGSFAVDSQPGAGHFINEEQPQAVVASVLRVGSGGNHPAREPRQDGGP